MTTHESLSSQEIIYPEIFWHVASYFLVQRDLNIVEKVLQDNGLSWDDYYRGLTSDQRKKIGWEEKHANENGIFIFPPKTLILGHTQEEISVPTNSIYYMGDFFISARTNEQIPLKTNLSAPWIHPGYSGPQTFEAYNTSMDNLEITVADLLCPVLQLSLSSEAVKRGNGQFASQRRGEIELGEIIVKKQNGV